MKNQAEPKPDVLVVGTGFLGSELLTQLKNAGRNASGANFSGHEAHSLDVSSPESVEHLAKQFDAPPAWVVHCASSGRGNAAAYRRVFVEGCKNLQAAFPNSRVIFTSSTSVYSQIDGKTVTEKSPANPERETSCVLREAEDGILAGSGNIVLRLAGLYGPGRIVYLQQLLEGTAKIESGKESRWLNQIHRDDAASAIVHLISISTSPDSAPSEIYNVCDDCPFRQRELCEELADILGLPLPPEAPPDLNRKRAWTNKKVSNEKLRATGWEPRFPSFLKAVEESIYFRIFANRT